MTNIGTKYILAQKFIFDPYSNTLTDLNDDSNVVRLGSNESRILLILIENSNQVVSRDQLHEYVWRDQGFQVDDSSLTQAISTLRKMLQDSTKSPQFVKTVPKRGYQLIAEIELATPPKIQEESVNDTAEQAPLEEKNTTLSQESTTSSISPTTTPASTNSQTVEKEKIPLWLKLIWVVIILVPALAWFAQAPKSGDFTRIALADKTPLLLLSNQTEVGDWLPIIQQCTQSYQSHVKTPLLKVITTGGGNENIALNFIHDETYTDQNKTIVLFVNQTNYKSLCQ
ncbi:winged helix-turn-helix domain-containing protein [Vibrio gangliei]|uniref:winged helix-turn-helix domain-containing protein n=1 Tax=Vibrio gangliei TaxID=2077090 RepID=UPI000D01AFFA|nr:transcriptional regulator [Vibrio gangliei]